MVPLWRVLWGIALLVVALGPLGAAACAVRRRFLGWTGVTARISEIVLVLSAVVVVAEVLGLFGGYELGPLVAILAVVGGQTWWWVTPPESRWPRGRRSPAGPTPPAPAPVAGDPVEASPMGRWGAVLSVVAVAVLVADWGPPMVNALSHGMTTIDTLWYHMPIAARFVQTGSIWHVHYYDSDSVTAFYPANSELLHGFGILAIGTDVFSPLLDLLWLALALASGWSIGRRYGLAPLTLVGVAVLFATPGLVGTQPGGAYTDVVSVALLLATFAILIEAHRHEHPTLPAYAIAALAAGLALGTKYTMLAPVAALTIGVVVIAERGQRLRRSAVWLAGLAATGGFWYLRNLITVGNPLPSLGLKLGPITFRNLSNEGASIGSVAHYLFDGPAWRQFLVPGLDKSLGWGWWLVLGLCIASAVVMFIGPTRAHRLLAFVGLASLAGYVLTQQVLGPPGHPIYFGVNVRYLAPGIALALTALPAVAVRWPKLRNWIFGIYLAVLASLQLNPTTWPIHVLKVAFVPAVTGVDAWLGLALGGLVLLAGLGLVLGRERLAPLGRHRWGVAGAVFAVAAIGLLLLTPYYQRHRFDQDPYADEPFVQTSYTWARDLKHQRIGIFGAYVILQYPLYGTDLSNQVSYLGHQGTDGSFNPIQDCATWRQTINDGHYDYVYLTTVAGAEQTAWTWTETDPAVEEVDVHAGAQGKVFRVHGPLDPSTCPAP